MALIIEAIDLPEDIASNAMAPIWIDGANARASRVAPCLASTDPAPTHDQLAEARLVLIGAVLRWAEAGSGAVQSKSVGPAAVTFDTSQARGFKLWPNEIVQLQDICKSSESAKAFSIDTIGCGGVHSAICSIYFGGECSCGASTLGQQIYE